MYPVSANFHTLAIADSPKTRCRIFFISDAVNCWDDNDVQTNGTLLVGAVGDTDSNGRIGQGGVTVTEIFNKDKNLTLGGTVSYQIGMTLVNSDGALNNFAFGRCKVYLDVYDDANSTWLPCPLGVFRIELPVKRKVQLISCSGYDQMQALNAIADTWWNGLNFTGGLTIENILNSMVTQLGLHLSATSSTNMVNKTLSFTTPPIDSVERTYRDILGWIAEATGTVAHFNRKGELDMRQYLTPYIGGNSIVIDTDTTGNQCLSIDVAEYSVSKIDALTIKLTTADQGVTVGSGTNVYTIMDNPFLYGPDVATIQSKLTPIYNRLRSYVTYSPISTRLIYDWSIEAGDIIYIRNNSTTYRMPIFQQKMVWRGGYVTSELISSGDTVRPQVSSGERETYRYNVEMATKVGDNEIISKINQTAEQIQIQASKVNLTGYITATNLATAGQTVINGGNITTGELSADRISGGTLVVGGQNNTNGEITILDSSGNLCGTINNIGVNTLQYENGRLNTLSIGGGYMHLQTGGSTAALLNRTTDGGAVLQLNDSSGRQRVEISGESGTIGGFGSNNLPTYYQFDNRYIQYFGDTDNHISTDLGHDTTRSFLTLNSPDGSSDIFLDTLPANGSRFNSPTTFNAAVTMNSTLDVTPRRYYARLSKAGWYRVMKMSSNRDDWSFAVDFCVTRSYANTDNEVHTVKMLQTYGTAPSFVNENSKSNNLIVTAIRYTVDSNGACFVDIRYNANSANTVAVDFTVHAAPTLQQYFTAEQLQEVVESPNGETELVRYTFAANTEYTRYIWTPTFSGTANPSVSNALCFYSVKNGVLYAGGRFNLASFTSGGTTVSFTLPVSLGSADRSAETIGTMFTTTKTLQLRWTGSTVYITDAGGNFSGGLLNTGYWSFQIVAPIYN